MISACGPPTACVLPIARCPLAVINVLPTAGLGAQRSRTVALTSSAASIGLNRSVASAGGGVLSDVLK